jgi:hypothetical protein
LATGLLAFGSAYLYERFLICVDILREVAFIYSSIFWADRVGRYFGIDVTIRGQDEHGLFLGEVLEEKKELLSRADSFFWIPYIIYTTGSVLVNNALTWASIFAFHGLWRIARVGFLFYIRRLRVWHWQEITAYIDQDKIWVDCSRLQGRNAVDTGESTLLSRFVGQVALQTALAVAMLLVSFLYRLRRDAAREIDGDNYEAFQIWKVSSFWRAAASHLTLYTSYQVFRYLVEFEQSGFPPRVEWILWIVSFFRYLSNGLLLNPCFGGRLLRNVVLTLAMPCMWAFTQIGLGCIVKEFTGIGWELVEPIYAWLTPWRSAGLRIARRSYLGQVVKDFGLNDVLQKRFLMHVLFGDRGPLATYLPGAQVDLEQWW